jgi:hypothetical protein
MIGLEGRPYPVVAKWRRFLNRFWPVSPYQHDVDPVFLLKKLQNGGGEPPNPLTESEAHVEIRGV